MLLFVNMRLAVSFILFPFLVSSTDSFAIPWKLLQSTAIRFLKSHDLDPDCSADLESLILDAPSLKPWAIKMLDASSKINPGIMLGNLNLMGDFDECLSIKETINGRVLSGKYCTVLWGIVSQHLRSFAPFTIPKHSLERLDRIDPGQVLPKISLNISMIVPTGICVPKSCSIESLDKLFRSVEQKFGLPQHLPLIEDICVYEGKPVEFTNLDIAIYCFFVTITVIISIITIYDIYLRYTDQNPDLLVCFSAYTNIQTLFSLQFSNQKDLDCLDGIRVISAFWVLLGHATVGIGGTSKNLVYILTEWKSNVWNTPFWSGFYAVGNFVTISGLLLTYTFLRLTKTSPIGLFTFYAARFARLTPGLLATALIHTSFMKLLPNGPFAYGLTTTFTKMCQERWWRSLYHFVNWREPEKCLHHGWYMAMDSQLYVCAPLALFFIRQHPRRVMTGLGLAFLVGVVYSFVITVTENIGFLPFQFHLDFQHSLSHTLLHHVPSWVIGIIFGYLLHEKKIQISHPCNITLWILSSVTMLKLITNQLVFLQEGFNVYRAVLWNTLARPMWSLALCLMITSCATGNGGLINSFLSHPIFRILRRLSYGIYLLHLGVMGVYMMNMREAHLFSTSQMICQFIILSTLTVIASIPFYLAFEAPLEAYRIYKKNSDEAKLKQKSS